jgi:hypothetical protein
MTQHEFAQGWKLLILQPWGARYRTLTKEGQPSEESRTQLEFYYDKLKFGSAEAWRKTAELFASGEKWPSVNELRETLSHFNRQVVKAVEGPKPDYRPMPDDIREMIQRATKSMPGQK